MVLIDEVLHKRVPGDDLFSYDATYNPALRKKLRDECALRETLFILHAKLNLAIRYNLPETVLETSWKIIHAYRPKEPVQ